jgi:hypothetical protein
MDEMSLLIFQSIHLPTQSTEKSEFRVILNRFITPTKVGLFSMFSGKTLEKFAGVETILLISVHR